MPKQVQTTQTWNSTVLDQEIELDARERPPAEHDELTMPRSKSMLASRVELPWQCKSGFGAFRQ
eukprot:scaffold283979_cov19-Tisochrysis_lutea.AAC.3